MHVGTGFHGYGCGLPWKTPGLPVTLPTLADPGPLGHEYVRHIAAEPGEENTVQEGGSLEQTEGAISSSKPDVKLPGTVGDLRRLAKQCAGFFLVEGWGEDCV